MPELSDVARFKKYLDATALHQAIRHVVVHDRDVLDDLSARRLRRTLQGRSFKSTSRRGKFLAVELDRKENEGPWLVMHFGMTGYFDYARESKEPPDHARVTCQFEGGHRLAYACQRKLGLVTLADDMGAFFDSRNLGPDALDEGLDFDAFAERSAGRSGAVKPALMNQQIVAGIGNFYSDEILCQARMHPKRTVDELARGELRGLHRAMRKVLRKAVQRNGQIERLPPSYLLPHREGDGLCPRCEGQLDQVKVSGRTAHFCRRCQE